MPPLKHFTKKLCFSLLWVILFSSPALLADCQYTTRHTPSKGQPLGTIRLMTMNVWGQKDDSEAKCEARLNYIGETIANARPPYQIIGLTEVHPDYLWVSCDGKALLEGIRSKGGYGEKQGHWGQPETPWYHYDGGVSLFSTAEFESDESHVRRFAPEYMTRTAHGFIFARLQLSPQMAVDVYVAHLYSYIKGSATACDRQCRYRQLEYLAQVIHTRSADSGNPVLVMGDFNIDGPPGKCTGNQGYGDIMQLLRQPRDVWMEAHPDKPGYTINAYEERIDYIFILTDSYFTNSSYELVLKSPDDVKLLDWTMPGYTSGWLEKWQAGPFPVSDHKGIEATLSFIKRPP